MSATSTQQVLHNGRRNLILKYNISGSAGDVTAQKLVDLSALDSTLGLNSIRLDKVDWSFSGFSAKLAWDADVDEDLVELCVGSGLLDFNRYGGTNTTDSAQTGDIVITTTGFSAGDTGSIILYLKKKSTTQAFAAASPEPGLASLGITGYAPGRLEREMGLGSIDLTTQTPTRVP